MRILFSTEDQGFYFPRSKKTSAPRLKLKKIESMHWRLPSYGSWKLAKNCVMSNWLLQRLRRSNSILYQKWKPSNNASISLLNVNIWDVMMTTLIDTFTSPKHPDSFVMTANVVYCVHRETEQTPTSARGLELLRKPSKHSGVLQPHDAELWCIETALAHCIGRVIRRKVWSAITQTW